MNTIHLGKGEVQVDLYYKNHSLVNTFNSIKDCAPNLNIPEKTLSRKLNTGASLLFPPSPPPSPPT